VAQALHWNIGPATGVALKQTRVILLCETFFNEPGHREFADQQERPEFSMHESTFCAIRNAQPVPSQIVVIVPVHG